MNTNELESVINGFKKEYVCPHCGNTQEVALLPYINFTTNPEYYALVKDLSCFKVKCEKCGKEEYIKFDALIVDETHKYFLYFLSDKSLYNRFKFQITYFIETTLNKDNSYDLSNYKTRLVYNLNDIVEKMQIFELNLNDEVIELIKAGLFEKDLIDKRVYDVIYFDGLEKGNLKFVALNMKSTTSKPKFVEVNFQFYNKVIDDTKNISARHKDHFEIIDQDWVNTNFVNK